MLLIILLIFSCSKAWPQTTNKIDSLTLALTQGKNYEEIISTYKKLAYQQSLKQTNEVNQTCDNGIILAVKHADSVSIGVLVGSKGRAQYFMGHYDSAAYYYIRSIKILENKDANKELGETYNDLGRLYRKIKQYQRATESYTLAIDYFKAAKDLPGIAAILNESGVVFEDQNNFKEAINRYDSSLKIQQQLHDEAGIAYALNFIGGAYTSMHDYNQAESYQLKALAIRLKLRDSFALALNYQDISAVYIGKKDFEKAKTYLLKSNELANIISFTGLLSNNYNQLASVEYETGNYKQAYLFYKKHEVLQDSLFKMESIKQINELSAQFETNKKEQKITLLNKQNTIQQLQLAKRNMTIIIIIGLFILFVIITYLFYNRYRLKQSVLLQTAVIQQQDIASKRIIEAEEAERKRIAGDLHDGIGQLFSTVKMNLETLIERYVITSPDAAILAEKTMAMVDESCTEVRSIAHQMMPNALIKSGLVAAIRDFVNKIPTDRLKVTVETKGINEHLDTSVETVLYRVIQESVNNVIKHADATTLDILLLSDAKEITVTIEDNGKGFEKNDQTKFKGIGIKNMTSRVEYLKGSVEISSSPGKGTLVAIYVPLA